MASWSTWIRLQGHQILHALAYIPFFLMGIPNSRAVSSRVNSCSHSFTEYCDHQLAIHKAIQQIHSKRWRSTKMEISGIKHILLLMLFKMEGENISGVKNQDRGRRWGYSGVHLKRNVLVTNLLSPYIALPELIHFLLYYFEDFHSAPE